MIRLKTIILLLMVLSSLPLEVFSQNILFEKVIDMSNEDQILYDVEKTNNNQYLAVGQIDESPNMAILVKMTSLGQLIWTKELFLDSAEVALIGEIVKVRNENNFYISGYAKELGQFNYDFLAKIDADGDTLWIKKYSYSSVYQTTLGLTQLIDKSVIMIGEIQTSFGFDLMVRRVDSLGNTMWEKIYNINGQQQGRDIVEMMDGSLIVAGVNNNSENLMFRIGFDGSPIDTISVPNNPGIFDIDAALVPGNRVFHTGAVIGGDPASNNFNLFYDKSYQYMDNLGSNTWGCVVDDTSNVVVAYWELDSLYLRYSSLFQLSNIWEVPLGDWSGSFKRTRSIKQFEDNTFLICGTSEGSSNRKFWLAEIDGIGNKWIPDRCSYQPPVAGFEYEYNYPLLTLRDTSSGGLKYLDTVYTWQWTTSNGFSGNEDSLLVFFDTSINKTIDIELVISNWYGCTDTVSQTLVLGETGIEVFKEFEVKVFPKPTKDILNIQFDNSSGQASFKLYDLQGRLQIVKTLRKDNTIVSLHKLPQGLYIYEIGNANQSRRGKIVKE